MRWPISKKQRQTGTHLCIHSPTSIYNMKPRCLVQRISVTVCSAIMCISLSRIGYNVNVISITWTFICACWLRHNFSDQCEDISLGNMPYYFLSDPIFIVSFSVTWRLTRIQLMLYCNKLVQTPQIHTYAIVCGNLLYVTAIWPLDSFIHV